MSLEQLEVYNGPRRQIILGVAGCGKTIILQRKALEVLSLGESVAILTTNSGKTLYKNLFDSCGYKNYTINNWWETAAAISSQVQPHKIVGPEVLIKNKMRQKCKTIETEFKTKLKSDEWREAFAWLILSENVIIDDAFDEESRKPRKIEAFYCYPVFVMILAKLWCPKNLVWAAMDAHAGVTDPYTSSEITGAISVVKSFFF